MSSVWQILPSAALHWVTQGPIAGENLVNTLPVESVVTAEGLNSPMKVLPLNTLFCSLKMSTTPWIPIPFESRAWASRQISWLQLVTSEELEEQPTLVVSKLRRSELRMLEPQQAAGSNAPGLHLRPPSDVMHVVLGLTS